MIVWALFDSGNGCYTQGAELFNQLVSQSVLQSLQVSQSLLVSRVASLLVNRSANQFPLVTQLLSASLYLLAIQS